MAMRQDTELGRGTTSPHLYTALSLLAYPMNGKDDILRTAFFQTAFWIYQRVPRKL